MSQNPPASDAGQAAAAATDVSESTGTAGALTPTGLEIASVPVRPELQLEVIATRTGQFGGAGPDTTGYGLHSEAITLAPAATRPYGGWFDDVVDHLIEDLTRAGVDPAAAIEKVVIEHDELTLFIAREHLLDVVAPLRDDQDLRFELCLGVSGVHYPQLAGRELHACIQLMSLTHGGRQLRLEVTCPETDPRVPSIVSIYPGNDWHERETWDLMGIIFEGHPSLTRTAMPDDWVGHPQRKDYPLGGIPVEYKGASTPPADTRRSYS